MTAYALVPYGHVRIGLLRALPDLLQTLGGNLPVLLSALRLPADLFESPGHFLPIRTLGQLLAQAADQVQCEHLGLLLGAQTSILQQGGIGQKMRAMPNLGSALEVLSRWLGIQDSAAIVMLHPRRSRVGLSYNLFDGAFTGAPHAQDTAISAALNIMRGLRGPAWRPDLVTFAHRAPNNPAFYRKFFGCPCQFNSLHTELLFSASQLQMPLYASGSDEAGLYAVEAGDDQLIDADDWVGQVRGAAYLLLLSGGCSQQRIADYLEVSVRTLNRRLAAEGATYVDILDRARFAISRMLLKDTDLSIKAIAAMIGYSDAANFNRAYRRWTGIAPQRWRVTHGRP